MNNTIQPLVSIFVDGRQFQGYLADAVMSRSEIMESFQEQYVMDNQLTMDFNDGSTAFFPAGKVDAVVVTDDEDQT